MVIAKLSVSLNDMCEDYYELGIVYPYYTYI